MHNIWPENFGDFTRQNLLSLIMRNSLRHLHSHTVVPPVIKQCNHELHIVHVDSVFVKNTVANTFTFSRKLH